MLTEDEFQARRTRLLESASPDNIEATNFGAISEATRFTSRQGSLIVDPANGRRPPLTSSAQSRPQARSSFSPGEFSSVSDFGPYDRCLAFSTVPAAQPINRLEIVQAPGYVAIWTELLHDARLIPLDGRAHLGTSITTYAGGSRARWEGRTLVVETTNLNGKTSLSGNGGDRPTTQLKVIERYILAEPDRLCYEATIDDPGTWTRPWTVAFPRTRDEHGRLYEDGCHEGNYSLANILRASRAADTRTSK